ncbi:MAG: N-formylglutamate deformylase [Burkholderiales bacterium]|nr:N-formylglutamate deformylase [Burkholderiales bacterium]
MITHRLHQGTQPLLVSMPHVGTYLPPALAARLTPAAQLTPDTDWHLEQLYSFAKALGASVLVATHSRYAIDLNRDPAGVSLYPGQSVTGLCPVDGFDQQPIYSDPQDTPDEAEVDARREALWTPYHRQLQAELARLKALHGVAVLWDAHSIRSVLPRFFEGKLPDLCLGTADGASCAPELADTLQTLAGEATGYSAVLNGRFKGGYITRQYGRPADGIHAVQLEMTQCCYMQEAPPFAYLPSLAAGIQPHLRRMLACALAFAQSTSRGG